MEHHQISSSVNRWLILEELQLHACRPCFCFWAGCLKSVSPAQGLRYGKMGWLFNILGSGAAQPTHKRRQMWSRINRKHQVKRSGREGKCRWWKWLELAQEEIKNKGNLKREINSGTKLETWASLKAAELYRGRIDKGGEHVQFLGLLYITIIMQRCFSSQYFHVKGWQRRMLFPGYKEATLHYFM